MRGSVSKYQITLKRPVKRRLVWVTRKRTTPFAIVQRARIVLLSAEGCTVADICQILGVDRQVARRWRKRFIEEGEDALMDRRRSGRPKSIEARVWEKVATLVVQPPENFNVALNRWTVRELSTYLAERYGWRVGRSSLSRFLRSMALKPHRIRYFLNPTDPEFDKKAAKICRLYIAPPAGVAVLSVDEKPGVQVRSRRHPTRPMRPGKVARVEFEYTRHGTRNVFAAFDIRTGIVIVEVTKDRKVPRVLAFLDQIRRAYPRGRVIIITDNINTRRGPEAKAWLEAHPRFRFVFTPYHGSWLNQVEIWFGILTRKCLRGVSFDSLAKLAAAVYRFTTRWNRDLARPFEWTYTGKVLHA
jgi:transposase